MACPITPAPPVTITLFVNPRSRMVGFLDCTKFLCG